MVPSLWTTGRENIEEIKMATAKNLFLGSEVRPVARVMKPAPAMLLETRLRAAPTRVVKPDGEDAERNAALKKAIRAEKEAKLRVSRELAAKVAKLQSTEQTPEGYYELNALMSNALEGELQKIMNEVWGELPESPPSDNENVVMGKFRTEVGDNIKNALGLNVSKRILKVTNSLYVKVEFDRKPFGLSIQNFIRWLNCVSMKRVLDGQHNYVALLRNQADFDRVTGKGIMSIGGLSATISPYYKFTKCPMMLKTKYKVKKPQETDSVERKSKIENSVEENTDANKTCKDSDKKILEAATTVKKPVPVSETAPVFKLTPVSKPAALPKPAPVSNTTQVSKTTPVSKPAALPKPAPVSKTTPVSKPGPVSNTTQVSKTIPVSKTTPVSKPAPVSNTTRVSKTTQVSKPAPVSKTTPVSKPVPVSTATTENTKLVEETPQKVTQTTEKVVPKIVTKPPANTTPAKPNVAKTTPTKAATAPVKDVSKTALATPNKESKAAEKAQVTTKPVNKSNTTKPPAAKAAAPNKTNKNKPKNKGDFDELDDEDILALMSDAIVLDECSGSEEEN